MSQFWSKQPVPQSKEQLLNCNENKAITIKEVNNNEITLPKDLSWYNIDIDNIEELSMLYNFLRDHYVGNEDFRFNYSQEFLLWALNPPGYKKEYILSIRSDIGKKPIVGFISAIPATISVQDKLCEMVEINYLCVHSKIRKCNIAPVLIKEITRRANLNNIWQAVYTAGVTLPTPISICTYHHRPLNTKKLIDIEFINIKPNSTISQNIKLYKLPEITKTQGLRELQKTDCLQACKLLNEYLGKFTLHPIFTIDEFEHWFCGRNNVIESYVVEDPDTYEITDMISFYIIQSTILNNSKHSILNTAYLFYYFANKTSLTQLVNDMLIIAYKKGMDVFNCLDIHDNSQFINEVKFKKGNGELKYYLYNYLTKPIDNMGLVLL